MELPIILCILTAAVMMVVILSFVFFIVALRCKKRKENRNSHWIRSRSIEHFRFSPRNIEEQRIRISSPRNMEDKGMDINPPAYSNVFSCEECLRAQNIAGLNIPQYANPPEPLPNSSEIQESSQSRHAFRTFTPNAEVKEPLYVYWETHL